RLRIGGFVIRHRCRGVESCRAETSQKQKCSHSHNPSALRVYGGTTGGSMKRLLLIIGIVGFGHASADDALRQQAASLFGQIKPASGAVTPQVELGRALYWDTRASADGKTACASCHPARDWGADRRRFSPDARGALTSRHSPTVFNSVSQP